jgi:hypothetical protein
MGLSSWLLARRPGMGVMLNPDGGAVTGSRPAASRGADFRGQRAGRRTECTGYRTIRDGCMAVVGATNRTRLAGATGTDRDTACRGGGQSCRLYVLWGSCI